MSIGGERIKRIGGRCLDAAMGVFLICVLLLIWSSSRTNAESAKGSDVVKTKKLRNNSSRSNIEALTAMQGTIDVCLQDDSDPSIKFIANSTTGAYTFCCGGTTFTGIAQVTRRGEVVSFAQLATDRRVRAIHDGSVFKGNAALQFLPGTTKCTIGDRDTRNNTCACGKQPE